MKANLDFSRFFLGFFLVFSRFFLGFFLKKNRNQQEEKNKKKTRKIEFFLGLWLDWNQYKTKLGFLRWQLVNVKWYFGPSRQVSILSDMCADPWSILLTHRLLNYSLVETTLVETTLGEMQCYTRVLDPSHTFGHVFVKSFRYPYSLPCLVMSGSLSILLPSMVWPVWCLEIIWIS